MPITIRFENPKRSNNNNKSATKNNVISAFVEYKHSGPVAQLDRATDF